MYSIRPIPFMTSSYNRCLLASIAPKVIGTRHSIPTYLVALLFSPMSNCELCLSTNPSAGVCQDCSVPLCAFHIEAHQQTKTTKTHLIKFDEMPTPENEGTGLEKSFCEQHHKILEFYCQECDLLLCPSCNLQKFHSRHHLHDATSLYADYQQRELKIALRDKDWSNMLEIGLLITKKQEYVDHNYREKRSKLRHDYDSKTSAELARHYKSMERISATYSRIKKAQDVEYEFLKRKWEQRASMHAELIRKITEYWAPVETAIDEDEVINVLRRYSVSKRTRDLVAIFKKQEHKDLFENVSIDSGSGDDYEDEYPSSESSEEN